MADYIDRKGLRKALYEADEITFDGLDIIDNYPAADVQPVKHGKWKLLGEPPWYVRECSECREKWHHWSGDEMPNFCSNCGADMRGADNEKA